MNKNGQNRETESKPLHHVQFVLLFYKYIT